MILYSDPRNRLIPKCNQLVRDPESTLPHNLVENNFFETSCAQTDADPGQIYWQSTVGFNVPPNTL